MLQVKKIKKARGRGKADLDDTGSALDGFVGQDILVFISRDRLSKMMTRMERETRFHMTSALSGRTGKECAYTMSAESTGSIYEGEPGRQVIGLLSVPGAM